MYFIDLRTELSYTILSLKTLRKVKQSQWSEVGSQWRLVIRDSGRPVSRAHTVAESLAQAPTSPPTLSQFGHEAWTSSLASLISTLIGLSKGA